MQDLSINLHTDLLGNLITKQAHSSQNILHRLGVKNFNSLISVEFLLDLNDELVNSSVRIKNDLYNEMFAGEETVIKFPHDGTFTYYKFIVPKINYFHNGFVSENEKSNKQIPIYTIQANEVFYYNSSLYVSNAEVNGHLSDVLNNASIIKVTDICEYLNSHILSFQKVLFSYCKLQKCLVNLQSRILKNPNNCNGCGTLSGKTLDRYNRDFLLSAIYLLDYLTQTNNFEEAQTILDSFVNCSGSICDDSELKSSCNCG